MHAYDLSRLQKPIDSNDDPMIGLHSKPPMDEPIRRYEEMPKMGKLLVFA